MTKLEKIETISGPQKDENKNKVTGLQRLLAGVWFNVWLSHSGQVYYNLLSVQSSKSLELLS